MKLMLEVPAFRQKRFNTRRSHISSVLDDVKHTADSFFAFDPKMNLDEAMEYEAFQEFVDHYVIDVERYKEQVAKTVQRFNEQENLLLSNLGSSIWISCHEKSMAVNSAGCMYSRGHCVSSPDFGVADPSVDRVVSEMSFYHPGDKEGMTLWLDERSLWYLYGDGSEVNGDGFENLFKEVKKRLDASPDWYVTPAWSPHDGEWWSAYSLPSITRLESVKIGENDEAIQFWSNDSSIHYQRMTTKAADGLLQAYRNYFLKGAPA